MKKRVWIIIFLAMQLNNAALEKFFKPLLIPVLFLLFVTELKGYASSLKTWIFLALACSWFGDILLMFQEKNSVFFLAGLASFLLAHIFYIISFHKIRIREKVKSNPLFLLLVVIYYGLLIWWLNPFLGDMKLPVRIYGIVISFMFMLALHLLFISNKKAGRQIMIGALLFVISDSVLAINKFYQSFEGAGITIMLTYGIAQLLIISGMINYIRKQTNS
jgi:uncharacterized membrane protein YhhN